MEGAIDIYARRSAKGDREMRSTSGQIEVCRAVLQERGLPLGEVFKDDGASAWNPKVERKDFAKLMARLESGAAAGVCVYDLERFSRQPPEGERLIAAAVRGLLVIDSDQQLDLSTASGQKAFRDAMSAAAYYSHRLSDKVKRGKRRKAMAGQLDNGGELHRPFGFEQDRITIRESEADILRMLVEHFLHGDSQPALITFLNRRGITTSVGREWSMTGLRALLTRPRNAGWLMYNDAAVARLPGNPIIDQKTHDRVVARYAARRRGRPPSDKYLCSGVAYCGLCERRLSGRPRANCKPYADGSVQRQYFCSTWSYPGACGRIGVDQRGLDELARVLTIQILSDPRHAAQVEAAAAQRAEESADLDAAIAADEHTLAALDAKLTADELTYERWERITTPMTARLAGLRARRDDLEDAEPVLPAAGSREQWAQRWEVALTEERRTLLRTALRGRRLLVGPAIPGDRRNVAARVVIEPGDQAG